MSRLFQYLPRRGRSDPVIPPLSAKSWAAMGGLLRAARCPKKAPGEKLELGA